MSASLYRFTGEQTIAFEGNIDNGAHVVRTSVEPSHAVALFMGLEVSEDGFTVNVFERAIEAPETLEELKRERRLFIGSLAHATPTHVVLPTIEIPSRITPAKIAEVNGTQPERIGIYKPAGFMIKNNSPAKLAEATKSLVSAAEQNAYLN